MTSFRHIVFASILASLCIVSGCRVSVDQGKNGENKNVKVDTPLGGVHVKSDDVSAADVGLPVYPGAQVSSDKDGSKSADVHFGFGDWQFRLKVVSYQSPDSQDKVIAFYRKALGRFGNVIECKDKEAVGSPVATQEGLTCSDDSNKGQVKVSDNLTLKAGSKRHQHIMAIEDDSQGGTRFSLVQIELPASSDSKDQQTN